MSLDGLAVPAWQLDAAGRLSAWSEPLAALAGPLGWVLERGGPAPEVGEVVAWEGRRYAVVRSGRTVTLVGDLDAELLERARRDAERAEQARSEFLGQINHEMRTPLDAIVRLSDPALEPVPDALRAVHVHARSLQQLIADLLDFANIEAGLLELLPVPCDWVALIRSEIEAFRATAVERGLELEVRIAEDLPQRASVDPARLAQVVRNLVSNAVRYTWNGGVSVALKEVEAPQAGRWFELMVRDTGVGISERDQRVIFTRFYRAYRTMEAGSGSGLGLAITRSIVLAMQGRIKLKSQPGQGSTFRVRLPLAVLEQTRERPMPQRARVLLAEDNPDSARITARSLEGLGHRVVHVTDGDAALRAAFTQSFELVLMDLDMPRLGGIQATRELRAREELLGRPRVPVVALTAHAMPSIRRRCEAAGMDGFLTKPVETAVLLGEVRRWVGEVPPTTAPDVGPAPRQLDPDIADLVPEYLADRHVDLQEMRAELEEGDLAGIRRRGHQLKGSGTTYGFPELTAIGALLEAAARDGDAEVVPGLLAEIEAVLLSMQPAQQD